VAGRIGVVLMLAVASASPTFGPRDGTLRFSHALHLGEVGMECLDCHAGALESESASDLLFPKESVCLACHEREGPEGCGLCHTRPEAIAPLSNPLSDIFFSHRLHLLLPDLAGPLLEALASGRHAGSGPARRHRGIDPSRPCSVCHRGLEEVSLGGPDNLPEMADCLVCHTSGGDAMRRCGDCHPPGFDRRPQDHRVVGFFDAHSAAEARPIATNCRMCHTPGFNPCTQCH
jgi:hypothetical protein